jgi:hypothetical protein
MTNRENNISNNNLNPSLLSSVTNQVKFTGKKSLENFYKPELDSKQLVSSGIVLLR